MKYSSLLSVRVNAQGMLLSLLMVNPSRPHPATSLPPPRSVNPSSELLLLPSPTAFYFFVFSSFGSVIIKSEEMEFVVEFVTPAIILSLSYNHLVGILSYGTSAAITSPL